MQLGDTYNQVDIVYSRISFVIQILNMSREQNRIEKLDFEHREITNRLKLKLSKNDIDAGVHIFINVMSRFNSLIEIIVSKKNKKNQLADILTEEMIDNCGNVHKMIVAVLTKMSRLSLIQRKKFTLLKVMKLLSSYKTIKNL